MDKVDAICAACGSAGKRNPKPAPKNNKEKKQTDFFCRSCGARNLRDGTADLKEKENLPKVDTGKQVVTPPDAAPKVKEPERSIEDVEIDDDSPTIL